MSLSKLLALFNVLLSIGRLALHFEIVLLDFRIPQPELRMNIISIHFVEAVLLGCILEVFGMKGAGHCIICLFKLITSQFGGMLWMTSESLLHLLTKSTTSNTPKTGNGLGFDWCGVLNGSLNWNVSSGGGAASHWRCVLRSLRNSRKGTFERVVARA